VNSILYQPGAVVWPGEQPPSEQLVELIAAMNGVIELDYAFDLRQEVDEMAHMQLEPSQDLRLHYYHGYLLRDNSESRDYGQAYQLFRQTLDIAEQHGDLDSQVVLLDQLALMQYGMGQHSEALPLYQQALARWQNRALQLDNPPAEPELHFRERLAITQYSVGAFDASAGSLARALTIAHQRLDEPQPAYRSEVIAKALWTLGLLHRAQSDIQDGSESLLQSAIAAMRETVNLFNTVGAHEYDIARINIQWAETLLDLSYLYLQTEQDAKARDMRGKAWRHIATAEEAQNFSNRDDMSGRPLTALARLRHQITRLPDADAIREIDDFDAQLTAISQYAASKNMTAIVGKAAALRGEWLLWLGDAPAAREVFLQALAELQMNDSGEATRMKRLLRRSNDDSRPQRVRRHRRS
jgi:tetratricopeptide (TPR) repeat protein